MTIATLFNIKTQGDVSRYLKQTRCVLIKDFVPYQFRPDSQSREAWVKHDTSIAKELLECKNDEPILVADGILITF